MCTHCGCSTDKASLSSPGLSSSFSSQEKEEKIIRLETDAETLHLQHAILSGNEALAEQNRTYFSHQQIVCINLMGTPGAGKTLLLESLIKHSDLNTEQVTVLEGDQHSANDARRIIEAGGKALQINTGTGCHLDAEMIKVAIEEANLTKQQLLIIENVGNLVCPALFDLGETARIAMMAVTDGEDKPVKYPHMFSACDLVLINKIDLSPYIDFDLGRVKHDLSHLNPKAQVIPISAKTGEGMAELVTWIDSRWRHG